MIIGFLTHNNKGGAQKAMAKLQTEMNQEFAAMTVVYLYGKRGDVMENGDVLVSASVPMPLRYPLILIKLLMFFFQHKPVTSISFLPLANILVAPIAWLFGTKRRVISHRNPVWTYNVVLRTIDRLLGSLNVYTHIVANSEAVKSSFSHYAQSYRDKAEIIYNGVVVPDNLMTLKQARDYLGLNHTDFIYFAVGRLSQQKRYDIAIKALAKLPTGTLVIAGHGELHKELYQLAVKLQVNKRVIFLGAVPLSDVYVWLRAADIYLQTSEFEGQSNALLEAMAAESLVISSDIPPQREVLTLDDGRLCGVLVEGESADIWAGKIQSLLQDKTRQVEYLAMVEHRIEQFSVREMARRFFRLSHPELNAAVERV